jgi:hypothetical protein
VSDFDEALARAGAEELRLRREAESEAERAAKEAAQKRAVILAAVQKAVREHGLTAEEIFAGIDVSSETPLVPPADGVWTDAQLAAKAKELFAAGKPKKEVGEELQKLVPGNEPADKLRVYTALKAGESAKGA